MCSEKVPDGKSEEGRLRKEESQGAPPGSPAGKGLEKQETVHKARSKQGQKRAPGLSHQEATGATRRPLVTSEESLSTGGGPGSVKE